MKTNTKTKTNTEKLATEFCSDCQDFTDALPMTRATLQKLAGREFTSLEWERVLHEIPYRGIALTPDSELVLAMWRLPNGAKHVTLIDETQATWEAYCNKGLMDSERNPEF